MFGLFIDPEYGCGILLRNVDDNPEDMLLHRVQTLSEQPRGEGAWRRRDRNVAAPNLVRGGTASLRNAMSFARLFSHTVFTQRSPRLESR